MSCDMPPVLLFLSLFHVVVSCLGILFVIFHFSGFYSLKYLKMFVFFLIFVFLEGDSLEVRGIAWRCHRPPAQGDRLHMSQGQLGCRDACHVDSVPEISLRFETRHSEPRHLVCLEDGLSCCAVWKRPKQPKHQHDISGTLTWPNVPLSLCEF